MLNWIKRHTLFVYFVLTYAISWAIWLPIVLGAQKLVSWQPPSALYYLGAFGPMLAALIVTGAGEGRPGLANLWSQIVKWRVPFRYYALAVLVPFALFALALVINWMTTGAWGNLTLLGQVDYLPYLGIPGVVLLWMATFGYGEEIGWRGLALPQMLRTRSATTAALVIGVIWGCWHLPLFFFRDTYMLMGLVGFPMFVLSMVCASFILTWLYINSGGSILIAALFHALFDWFSASPAGGDAAGIIMSVFAIVWAIVVMVQFNRKPRAAAVQRAS